MEPQARGKGQAASSQADAVPDRDYGTDDEDRVNLDLAIAEPLLHAAATGDGHGRCATPATGDGPPSIGTGSTVPVGAPQPLHCMHLGSINETEVIDDLALGAVAAGRTDGDLATEPGTLNAHDTVAQSQAALQARLDIVDRRRAHELQALLRFSPAST